MRPAEIIDDKRPELHDGDPFPTWFLN